MLDIKRSQAGTSLRFKPHFNNAIGKYIHTSREYVKSLDDLGLEPQRSSYVKKIIPRPYTPSKWARSMINTLKNCSRDLKGNPKLGGRFWNSLKDHQGSSMNDLPEDTKQELSMAVKEAGRGRL